MNLNTTRVLNSHREEHVSIDDRVLARFIKNKAIKLSNGKHNGKILFTIWVGKTYLG